MQSGLISSAVLARISRDGIDPDRVVAEISTIAKADRYAILRFGRGVRVKVRVFESSLDPQIAAYISELLCDPASVFSRRTSAATIPFHWSFSNDSVVRRRAGETGGQCWADLASANLYVFFRRSSPTEKLLFITQFQPGAEPLDTERLFFCHGLAQVIFDQYAARSQSGRTEGANRITQREKECLRWCAEGKTSEEIGIILSLSTHTVNHYLISATKKLNAVNRMHAITVAVRQGILDIHDEP